MCCVHEVLDRLGDHALVLVEILGGEDVRRVRSPSAGTRRRWDNSCLPSRFSFAEPRLAAAGQIASKIPAAPMPVPMHMVTRAYLPPRRFSSCRAWRSAWRRCSPGDGPGRWRRRWRSIRGSAGSRPRPLQHGQALGGEGLVQFDDVHLVQGQPGLSHDLGHGRHRADAHDLRLDAGHGVAHEAGQGRRRRSPRRSPAWSAGAAARAVAHLAAVAGGHGAALLEGGPQPGQGLDGGVGARALVHLELHLLQLTGRPFLALAGSWAITGTISSTKRPASMAATAFMWLW